ncbi:hypothetical protein GG344DRAFT_71535 [Lentinula edodes]|nr:hypothetical protein GG344DRAFT_71535 [Lentinula edodes]
MLESLWAKEFGVRHDSSGEFPLNTGLPLRVLLSLNTFPLFRFLFVFDSAKGALRCVWCLQRTWILLRNQELENLKADASSFLASPRSTHSKDSDNKLLSSFPLADAAPRASSSTKVSVGRKEPKSKATVKVVEDSKPSNSPSSAMVYKRVRLPPCSKKIAPATSKGKMQQIVVTDKDSTSNEVESEDEDEEEDTAPPPKHLKTTSSISVKRVTKRVTKTAGKPAPECSPSSIFQPVLLVDAQGRLRLPNKSSGEFTPFPKFAHARNSTALSREHPLLAINPKFLELGSILEKLFKMILLLHCASISRVELCIRIEGTLFSIGNLLTELRDLLLLSLSHLLGGTHFRLGNIEAG